MNPDKPPWSSGYAGVLSRNVSVCTAGAEEEVGNGVDEGAGVGEGVVGGFKGGEGEGVMEGEGVRPGWHCQKKRSCRLH